MADIISGKINPSGKLSFTLAKRQEDYPCFRYGEYKEGNCRYKEGLFVGYRGFDKDKIEPAFPFGYGLSYSRFEYSDLIVNQICDDINISFYISNLSGTDGKEISQIYIRSDNPERPIRELKAFKKVLVKGNSKVGVDIRLAKRDFMYFNPATGEYKLFDKSFVIEVATNSRDIKLSTCINLKI